jgi:hypothetical protein
VTSSGLAIYVEHLFKLRLVVGRLGEMDNAGWWNTRGVLSSAGVFVYKRGLPTTHAFARARVVFAVAASRCQELFAPPNCATLWNMPADIEDWFEDQWQVWLDDHRRWQPFFEQVAAIQGNDVLATLHQFDLITTSDIDAVGQLKRSAEDRAVALPDRAALDDATVTLLAAGFAHAGPGKLAVPYVRVNG